MQRRSGDSSAGFPPLTFFFCYGAVWAYAGGGVHPGDDGKICDHTGGGAGLGWGLEMAGVRFNLGDRRHPGSTSAIGEKNARLASLIRDFLIRFFVAVFAWLFFGDTQFNL